MQNRFFIFLIIPITMMISCDSNRIFDQYRSIPDKWHKDSIVTFEIAPPDSLNKYDLFVNLRNTNDYEFSNLFLIVEMNFPNGKVIKDTLEYQMTEPSGKFLGEGFSDLKENKLWYKEGVVFNESGDYKVSIQHAMRVNGEVNGVENLEGITEVGFRVEKHLEN
ncbi:MAG: gliding motility lipoprotein GldH [Bacteroidia bacterium]|nr:gliding motility lipoprotein GldH [Bacteroidia bacterium]NND11944.1 gliding motility lipoprotein GldH [Flavobacteriaceae bacterium]MBT8310945.1 gliding motility lipoprotein GldH [Bacteroidia bacterium]NNK28460.1 gliding motility lipoprotein GldH [Flavobacteriaceae bacterium]NNL60097.1 gliding motility lipoprotein GldH [Flavobacteriaceae bacterium]